MNWIAKVIDVWNSCTAGKIVILYPIIVLIGIIAIVIIYRKK